MKTLTALSLCAALAGAGLGAGALAQDRPARAAVPPDMTASLLQGLRETEGCLGVDAARMMSGKNSIFAWFEDKAAVKRWYDHPVHRRMLAASGVEPDGEPMEHIEDGVPILVVATISFAGPPAVAESQIPLLPDVDRALRRAPRRRAHQRPAGAGRVRGRPHAGLLLGRRGRRRGVTPPAQPSSPRMTYRRMAAACSGVRQTARAAASTSFSACVSPGSCITISGLPSATAWPASNAVFHWRYRLAEPGDDHVRALDHGRRPDRVHARALVIRPEGVGLVAEDRHAARVAGAVVGHRAREPHRELRARRRVLDLGSPVRVDLAGQVHAPGLIAHARSPWARAVRVPRRPG